MDESGPRKLPVLDYCIGLASGPVLAGELGSDQLRFYDVLGRAVRARVAAAGPAGRWPPRKHRGPAGTDAS